MMSYVLHDSNIRSVVQIPYLKKKVENGYMAVYPHLSAYPKENEALIMKINEIILSHCGIHVTQNRICVFK